MAETNETVAPESFMDKITDKLPFHDDHKVDDDVIKEDKKVLQRSSSSSSSSSDEEDDKKNNVGSSSSSVKSKVSRLFGREKPVQVLGGSGKCLQTNSISIIDKLRFHDDHKVDDDVIKEDKKVPQRSPPLSSSSSAEEDDKKNVKSSSSVKSKISRLFGRGKPVHQVLGGGKPADVFLWRNKKVSATVLGSATAIWIFFELLEYHLLTLVCHILIFGLAVLFLWSSATKFINKAPPQFPELSLPEKPFLQAAGALRYELNRGLALLHDIATGKDLKKFLSVIAGLWLLSIVGKSCDFLTLFYINFVLLHTLPVLYEKHEDKVDMYAERALAEAKKHYGVVNERYISKIPRGPLSKKAD